jgi:hypothetical protein
MTRQTQPVELAVAERPEPEAASLPVLCDDASRAARAIAGRVERAAADLAGPAAPNGSTLALGHQDVWRFEADLRRAAADLIGWADHVAAWRATRDAEVARA